MVKDRLKALQIKRSYTTSELSKMTDLDEAELQVKKVMCAPDGTPVLEDFVDDGN